MKKTIWLTSLQKDPAHVRDFMVQMKKFGLDVQGHFWMDDVKRMAWMGPRKEILNEKVVMWGILGSKAEFSEPNLRYGLAMLAITIQASRGFHFPILILQSSHDPVYSEQLPTPLRGAIRYTLDKPGLGAKIVALIHKAPLKTESGYHLDIYGGQHIGQWFETGPENDSWYGAMFGVSGANILFHAVGDRGKLPFETVLNYPIKGMKLTLGDKQYIAWAVNNEIGSNTSYFVKVEGEPESIVFGPYSTQEEADVYVVSLK